MVYRRLPVSGRMGDCQGKGNKRATQATCVKGVSKIAESGLKRFVLK